MKTLRQLHLYLGCFFAPLIAFFAFSGILQTYRLNDTPKNGPPAPAWIKAMANVHKDQNLARGRPAGVMKFLTATMGAALVATIVLGVILAFKFGRSRLAVIGCLALGAAIPVAALLLVRGGGPP